MLRQLKAEKASDRMNKTMINIRSNAQADSALQEAPSNISNTENDQELSYISDSGAKSGANKSLSQYNSILANKSNVQFAQKQRQSFYQPEESLETEPSQIDHRHQSMNKTSSFYQYKASSKSQQKDKALVNFKNIWLQT